MPISKDGNKLHINCILTKDLYAAIQQAAEQNGCSMSVLFRIALTEWLENHADELLHD